MKARPWAASADKAGLAKTHQTYQVPAPVKGWISNASLAADNPGAALILENFFPEAYGVRVRGGARLEATIAPYAVRSLMVFDDGVTQKLFAASHGQIFDVTTPASTTDAPIPKLTGKNSDDWYAINVPLIGGNRLLLVNGVDQHLVFDGTSWAVNSPPITGAFTRPFSHVFSHANRIFLIEKDKASVWYLAVDAIGGTAHDFSLAGVFTKGGSVVFGATWSQDSGAGSSDRAVFFSSNGQCAVYEGTDPGNAALWRLFGVYDLSRPLSKKTIKIGGDLLILTEDGLIPLSSVISRDASQVRLAALSRSIEPDWRDTVTQYRHLEWRIEKFPDRNMILIGIPGPTQTYPDGTGEYSLRYGLTFAYNMQTGAWAKFTGWDIHALANFQGRLMFGTGLGRIFEGDRGGDDNGSIIYARYVGWPDSMGAPGQLKELHWGAAQFISSHAFNPKIGAVADYKLDESSAPSPVLVEPTDNVWDRGRWDAARWDADTRKLSSVVRRSIGRVGHVISPTLKISHSSSVTPAVVLVNLTLTFSIGGVPV